MTLYQLIADHVPVPWPILFFLILFPILYKQTKKIMSTMPETDKGRAALRTALSTSLFHEKIKQFGTILFSSGAFSVSNVNFSIIRFDAIFPKGTLLDRTIALTILLLAIAPWLSAFLGTTASWGNVTFAYSPDELQLGRWLVDFVILFAWRV